MRKATVAVAFTVLLITAVAETMLIDSEKANPIDLPVDTGISIYSPRYAPYQEKQYENSTVTLNIMVRLVYGSYDQSWPESVHLDSICYSLDRQPLAYVGNFAVENITNYGRDKQHFYLYTATVTLENLSEGSHSVIAYANDTHDTSAHINDLSASYNFTVNSHYQITVVKILSPINQTYSNAIPLIFTVNGEVNEAHYYMYRTVMWRSYEAVYEKHFDGNTTLDNLYDGNYIMHLYVTTEKGEAMTTAYFTISSSKISSSPSSTPDQTTEPTTTEPSRTLQLEAIIGTAVVVVSGALLVYFKRQKS